MTKNLAKKMLKSVAKDELFDFLYECEYELTSEELATIAREVAYALSEIRTKLKDNPVVQQAIKDLATELEDRLCESDD